MGEVSNPFREPSDAQLLSEPALSVLAPGFSDFCATPEA